MSQEKEKQQEDYSLTSFADVIVDKGSLLNKLKENRDNHQFVYDVACSGYWEAAKEVLAVKKVEFETAVNVAVGRFVEQFNNNAKSVEDKQNEKINNFSVGLAFNQHWPLKFPVNHLDDYNRVISMLEFSLADKVKLSAKDFDCYVMNNWNWQQEFAQTNIGYVSSITGVMFAPASGMSVWNPEQKARYDYLEKSSKIGVYR